MFSANVGTAPLDLVLASGDKPRAPPHPPSPLPPVSASRCCVWPGSSRCHTTEHTSTRLPLNILDKLHWRK